MVTIASASGGPFRLRDVHYDPREVHARHGHDQLQISVVLRGAVLEDARGERFHGGTGDVVIKPAGLMHANAFHEARIICLEADPRSLDFPLPEYGWHRTIASMRAAMRLVHHFHRGENIAEDVDDLLAAVPSSGSADVPLARRASRMLDDCFTEPLDVQRVAQHLGVHRVYLARVFRRQFECSPRDYVQSLRVRAAAKALASTRRALADIALEAGFSDQAHMNRVFIRTMGLTPRAVRLLSQT